MYKLALFLALTFGSLSSFGQSDVVDYLKDNQLQNQFKYVSESMIRAVCLMADSSGSFSDATKDVRRIVYFDSDQDAVTNTEMRKEIEKRMTAEGFEELMTMSSNGQHVKVAATSGRKELLGVVFQQDTSLTYLEVVGMVDLQKAMQLMRDPKFQELMGDMDLSKLVGL
jgi:hypothetical protein